jgi:solute carrier family 25 (mitochondrial carnitine/acylcarnitine transporter), member 20/29
VVRENGLLTISGIIIGSPFDLLKVQKQAGLTPSWSNLVLADQSRLRRYASLTRGLYLLFPFLVAASSLPRLNAANIDLIGALAPVLGYGALNGLLFVAYNRTLLALDPKIIDVTQPSTTSGWKIWLAGATGGLASWVISAPTELVKCRKQLGDRRGLVQHVQEIWRNEGPTRLYRGGAITSVRDAVGYGF